MKAIKNFLKLATSKTPKTGRKLAKVGIAIGGVGLGIEFTETQLIEFVAEEHRIYVVALKYICQTIGLLFVGGGVASTEVNPDNILGENE
jgi:hypothetical protein